MARETLPDEIRARGAEIDVVAAYQTLPPKHAADELIKKLKEGDINAVTFTASSIVRHFLSQVGGAKLLAGITVACIGPITAKTAEDHGLQVDVMAKEYTVEGLVEALENFYRGP